MISWTAAGRILEWVAISSSRASSWPRDWTCISCIAADSFLLSHWGSPIINCIPLPPPPKMCAFLRKNKANAFSTQLYHGSCTVWPLGSKVLPGPCPQVTKFSRLIPAGPSLPGGWGRPHLEERNRNQFPLQKSSCSCNLISIIICHDPSLQRADRSCKLENLSLRVSIQRLFGGRRKLSI